MQVKTWRFRFLFPGFPVPDAVQHAVAAGSRPDIAMRRAMLDVMRRHGVKGRRIEQMQILAIPVHAGGCATAYRDASDGSLLSLPDGAGREIPEAS